ncbi:hypothetical protein [Pseudomonas japonica]|uniref:Uncharacterized protein n=1 Tax=Pseudomonas japonica TaxID=256466 RepID=A0A239KY50_9PSED|nr:hypothetical protein [Pseudomonas japonica]SNT22975.1 hypothetical protein SAMN05444352_13019 [Pseudomonas japonica]
MAAKSTPQEQKPEAVQDLEPKPAQASDAPGTGTTDQDRQASANGGAPLDPEPEPEPEPATRGYRVTTRSDVLLNGQLYTEGAELLLADAVALPLLKNGCIKPKEGIQ